MRQIGGFRARLRALARPGKSDRDVRDELHFHVDMETKARIAAGSSPEDARREALARLGGVERYKDEARDASGATAFHDAAADIRHGWRLLLSHPAFSAAVILTLALGIGANTAIFSVVNAVLFQESPFPDPDRLVMVWETDRGSGTRHEPASWPDIEDFRARSRTLAAIGGVVGQDVTLSRDGNPERVIGLAATPNTFALLGVRPVAGRLFDTTGMAAAGTVVLGEEFWRSRFKGDPAIIGERLIVNERPVTVVGVVPADADLGILQVHKRADYGGAFTGSRVQIWLAALPTATAYPRDTHPFLTVARLAPGASVAAAQNEMASIAGDLERAYNVNANRGVNIESYSDVVFTPVRTGLYVLLGAVFLVLLVTCANVANLLLARSVARSREVALRLALGASVGRIRRQFLAESALLVALGTAAGIAMAFFGLRILVALAPADIPRLSEASVSGSVLLYTTVLAAAAAFAFGLLPAMRTRHVDMHEVLKAQAGRRMSEGPNGRRLRAALIVAEVALAVMLVNGAGLLIRSFWRLQNVDPGFNAAQVLKVEYQLPETRYPRDFRRWPDIPEINGFHARFLAAVQSLPGVRAAAISSDSPLDPGTTNSFVITGRESEQLPEIRTRFLSPGYLATLGVPLVEGRDLGAGDDAKAPPVVLINQAGARKYFPNGQAIGQVVRFWGTRRQIVGIVGDEHFRGVDAPTEPALYGPMAQSPLQSAVLLVRSEVDPATLTPAIYRALHDIDPQIAMYGVEPLRATLSGSIAKQRFSVTLLSIFGFLAILLALVGVHGVLSYTVSQRVPEIGIRVALGASQGRIMRGVVSEGLVLAGTGVAIGLAGALAGSRVLSSMVFGISTTDAATFVTVTLAVLATACLASLLPAYRATHADPMRALRGD
jgi:putative ABC transport system permease protein